MLSLNHLGLIDRGAEEGAVALRETLMLFADLVGRRDRAAHTRRPQSVQAKPVVRRIRTARKAPRPRAGVEVDGR